MSEERLKEIKNIFDMADIYGDDFEIARELYNEVIRLREENKYLDELRNANYLSWQDSLSRIEKAVEYIENKDIDVCTIRYNDIYDKKKELLNILNGEE